MDSRSQVDMHHDEDASMIALSQEVEEHTSSLRRSVMDTMQSMRAKVHRQALDIVEGERARSREHERKLLEHIEKLQALVDQRTDELAKERGFSERLLEMHRKQKERLRRQAFCQEALRRWKAEVTRRKVLERTHDRIVKMHEERLQRQFFNNWRFESMQERFQATLQKLDGEYRRAQARLITDHQTSENTMKLEMLAAKETLAKEEERRAVLEERLKAAFMRGVCALNMEAMHVLRSQGTDGDVSVASLLQGMNLSSSIDSLGVEGVSTEGLLRQQQHLQATMQAMHIDQEQDEEVAAAGGAAGVAAALPHRAAPRPSDRPAAATGTGASAIPRYAQTGASAGRPVTAPERVRIEHATAGARGTAGAGSHAPLVSVTINRHHPGFAAAGDLPRGITQTVQRGMAVGKIARK